MMRKRRDRCSSATSSGKRITGELIHVDFYEVRKGEKIEVEIPILFIGDAPALKASAGSTVAHELNTLNMQVLPRKYSESH